MTTKLPVIAGSDPKVNFAAGAPGVLLKDGSLKIEARYPLK